MDRTNDAGATTNVAQLAGSPNKFVTELGQILTPFQDKLLQCENTIDTVKPIATEFLTEFLYNVRSQMEIYMEHNVTSTATYFTTANWLNKFIAAGKVDVIYTFYKALLLQLVQIVDLGITSTTLKPFLSAEQQADEEFKLTKLVPQFNFSIIIILSGLFKSYIFALLKQCHEKDAETGKVTKVNQIIDIFNTKENAEFRKLLNEVINYAFTTLAPYSTAFRNAIASYTAFYMIGSPVLSQELLKVLKPLGKTFIQAQPQLTTLLYAMRTVKVYQQYSTTYHNVLRSNASAWYVADVVNATVAPKETTLQLYKPLLALFTNVNDVSLPTGVNPDIYNPDICQSMLKALKIRPAIAITSATHFLNATLSSQRNAKRTILTPGVIQGLVQVVIGESRQVDATRKENASKLFDALLQHLKINNPTTDLVALCDVYLDIIYQRNNQTMPTPPDQKIQLFTQIDAILGHLSTTTGGDSNTKLFDTVTTALLFLFQKEQLKDIKSKIITIIATKIAQFEYLPTEFFTTVMKLFIGMDLTKLDEVSMYATMFPVVIYNTCLPIVGTTEPSVNILTSMKTILAQDKAQKDALLTQLLKLINYSTSRPALFSSLLSYVLFYITIVSFDGDEKKTLPTEITTIFNTTSPLLTTVEYFNTTISPIEDAKTAIAILKLLTTINTELIDATTQITTDIAFIASAAQGVPNTDNKAYNKFIGFFFGIVNYALAYATTSNSIVLQQLTATLKQIDITMNIWFQFGFYAIIYKIQKLGNNKEALFKYFVTEPSGYVAPLPTTDKYTIISPYTAKLLPATSAQQDIEIYQKFSAVLFATTFSPSIQQDVTTLTAQQNITLLSALVLAAHPYFSAKLTAGGALSGVNQYINTVSTLYQSYYKNNNTIDYSAAFGNKQSQNFVQNVLFGNINDDANNNKTKLFGLFFTPIDTNTTVTPDLSTLSKFALKTPNTVSTLNITLSHMAVVFAAYYSKVSPIAFHAIVTPQLATIFKSNYLKMLTLLQPYHMAVWNTSTYDLCKEEEPKDLYDDEADIVALLSSPKQQKKLAKDEKPPTAQEAQRTKENAIRANITAAIQPVNVICCLLDYLIYINPAYSRDELLFIFYSSILQAMAGVPIQVPGAKKAQVYEEVYTITIYKDVCLPLLLSLCNSVDSHYSDDQEHVKLLKDAVSLIMLKHDDRTNNIFKLALFDIQNIDLNQAQKDAIQKENINNMYTLVDCLKALSSTTQSLYFTASSLSFIAPLLNTISSNINLIVQGMNFVEKKKQQPKKEKDQIPEQQQDVEDEDAEDSDDEDEQLEDEVSFTQISEKKKYRRETMNKALLHALLAVATILSNHAKPASTVVSTAAADNQEEEKEENKKVTTNITSSNAYPIDELLKVAFAMLNTLGTAQSASVSVLTNIPSTTEIQPNTILELLIDAITRLIGALDTTTNSVELFTQYVLSTVGLLSPILATRLATVAGLEKSKLLSSTQSFNVLNTVAQKTLSAILFTLRFDTDAEIATQSNIVFNKYSFNTYFITNATKDTTTTVLKYYLPEFINFLSAQSKSIRTTAAIALPYILLTSVVGKTEPVSIEGFATLNATQIDALYQDIIYAHDKLLSGFKTSQDVTVKKQSIRDKDQFISNGYKRQAFAQALLSISNLFAPQITGKKDVVKGTESLTYEYGFITKPLVQNTEKYYIPLLSKFFTTVCDVLIKDIDYDVWDSSVHVGTTFIHTHASDSMCVELISNILQDVLKKCEAIKGVNPQNDAQKEGVVILLSALSHYLQGQQHQSLLLQIFETLIKTVQNTAEPLYQGGYTPIIDSVQKSISAALVTIAKSLPRDIIVDKYFKEHYKLIFTTKIFGQRISSILVSVSIIKALGGGFLMKETTLLQSLNAVLTLNQLSNSDNAGPKLDKKALAAVLNECQSKIPSGGDKTSNVCGALTGYYYLFSFLPQQMAIHIPTILPKILIFFGFEPKTRDLTHNLAQIMMKCASQNIPGGAKVILPLLLGGLRSTAAWRTKICSLQLLSTIVSFSAKDLSTVLPSVIPRLIELRRDPNPDVAEEAAKVLNLLSSVVKNPQIKKIANILVQALHFTTVPNVTKALEALYTTVFMHYVDPIALAVIMPIVVYGLQSDRTGDIKKIAVQIAGSVSMITSNINDISPYIGNLLNLMQITLMDSTPEVRSVTAKAIAQMVRTQQQSVNNAPIEDAQVIASKQLLLKFDNLMSLLLDMLSLKRVPIPSANSVVQYASDGTTAVQRSGCCYGLSQLFFTKGVEYLDEIYESTIFEALSSQDAIIREGFTELMSHLPQVFQQDFAPLVVKSLPIVVGLLGDAHALVRDFAQQASQTMVQLFATTQTQELLATILEALVDPDYRVRTGSTVLAACFLLRLAGIEGEITIAEAEDEAMSLNKVETEIKDKTAITTEKQELGMLEYISLDMRNEIYSSLFLMCSDYVQSVSTVANRVFKAVTPSMSRMLNNILPRLVERITADLASFDDARKLTAGKSLSDLVYKLGDRILRDIIPILLDKFDSIDVYTRSGICLGFSQIFLTATKSMLSPYNQDIFPLLQRALCDRDEMVRDSAKVAFNNFCRAITTEKAVEAVIPQLLQQIDTYHNKYEELAKAEEDGTSTIVWADFYDEQSELYRYRHAQTHDLYDPSEDALSGLKQVVSLTSCQKLVLDRVIPYFLTSPITQFHVKCIATITQVCGKNFGMYLEQVVFSLAEALSSYYDEYYNDNDFEFVHEAVERYGADEETEEEYQQRKADKQRLITIHEKLIKREQSLFDNAFNVFIGLAPQNYYEILDLLYSGTANAQYLDFQDQCAWLKMLTAFWAALGKLNGVQQGQLVAPTNARGQRIEVSSSIDLDEFGININQSIQCILSFFTDDDERLHSFAADSLTGLLNCVHADGMTKYITYIRTQLNDITGRSRKAPYTRKIPTLQAFNHKELTSSFFQIAQHGIVTLISQPTIRAQCASIMMDVVDLSTTEGLAPHAMKLVGFLIRTYPDKLSIDIKANILSTIALLLKKCPVQLKAFQTQLKTLLTKTLLYVDEKQEAAAKTLYNASGQVIAAGVDNRNVIVDSDLLCERAAYTMSFLSQPQAFFADLVQGVLIHQHKIVAGKIAKAVTQIVQNRSQFDTISKTVVLDNIHKLLPTLTSEDAHDSVRIEVSRIIGMLVSLIPLEDAYLIIGNILTSCNIPTPAYPQQLQDKGLTAPTFTPNPQVLPSMKTRQSTAMVLSSVLISSQDLFTECVGFRPAVAFIARGFKDSEELSLTAVVRFAGRLLAFAAKHQHESPQSAQIVRMLTQELLNLASTTTCNTETAVVAILQQVKTFVETDPDAGNDLMNVIVPLCIRARAGAGKAVRKEIDIILYYTLLFNESLELGLENAQELADNMSRGDAGEFMDLCKRSVCKAVEKKQTPEELEQQQQQEEVW